MLSDHYLAGGLSPAHFVGYQTEFQVIISNSIFIIHKYMLSIFQDSKNHHLVKHHLLF